MKKEMLINCLQPEEIRIAIIEDGVLEELYVERASHESYVGNIYKGRIVNIEPSIQAAFVDFGVGRNGFLHVSDVEPEYYRRFEQSQSQPRGRGGERGGRGGRPQQRNYDDYDRPRRGGGGGSGGGHRQPTLRDLDEELRDTPIVSPDYVASQPETSLPPETDGPDIIVEEIIVDEDDDFERPRFEPETPEEKPAFGDEEAKFADPVHEEHREAPHVEQTASAESAHAKHEAREEPAHAEPATRAEAAPPEHTRREESVHAEKQAEAPAASPPENTAAVTTGPEEVAESEPTPGEEEEGEEGKPRRKTRRKPAAKTTSRSKKTTRKRSAKEEGSEESPGESSAKAPADDDEPKPRPMESSERRTDENDPSHEPLEPRPAPDLRDEDLSFSMAPRSEPRAVPRQEPQEEPKCEARPEPMHEPKPEPAYEPRPEPKFDEDLDIEEVVIEEPQDEAMGRFEEAETIEELVEEEKALEEQTEVMEMPEIGEIGEEEGPIVDLEDELGEIDEYVSRERGNSGRGDRGEPRGRGDQRGGDRGRGRGGDRDRGRGGRGDQRGGSRGGRPGDQRGGDRRGGRPGMGRPKPHIEDIFKRGQEVLVQVIKEGIGTKGPTLSTYISIAGRYLVLMPGLNRIGVSRKIDDEETRRRLREILNELKPPRGIGFIIRTAGQDRNKKELQSDLAYLSRLWQVVVSRIRKQKSPTEIYKESDMVTRTIRDIFTNDIGTIWVDERGAYEAAKEFMEAVMPRYAERIKFYEGTEPMFHKYGIENEIARIQMRHVPLPHGGSIVIDQTEAMVAIDVNSGNFRADNNNAEETAYQMNLHAAKEIARQLRLRDLGGVIANDFIDMRDDRHRRGVERALHDAVRRDRARTKILRISQFGIIEMTRQRIRPSLKRSAFHDCPHCKGTGHVKTGESVSIEVMRMLQLAVHRELIQRIEIRVHDEVAQYLQNRKRKDIVALEESGGKNVTIHSAGSSVSPEFLEFLCFDNNDHEVKFGVQEDQRPPRRRGF